MWLLALQLVFLLRGRPRYERTSQKQLAQGWTGTTMFAVGKPPVVPHCSPISFCTVAGMRTSSWKIPVRPGASPANSVSTGSYCGGPGDGVCTSIAQVTGCTGLCNGDAG